MLSLREKRRIASKEAVIKRAMRLLRQITVCAISLSLYF